MDIMIMKPIPRKAIWGHTKLKDYFNYIDFPDGIGQSWSFSGQENNANEIVGGIHVGETLDMVWSNHPEYFNSKHKRFPFIVGLVGPEDNLSIQVHPDARVARKRGLVSGKNEAWYFIEADEGADLVFGTNARNNKELRRYVEEAYWEQAIKRIPVHKDDFVYVPAGMLHAMQKGVITYEVQEACDVTYRFYDYDRVDDNGKKRELHQEAAFESVKYFETDTQPTPIVEKNINYKKTTYINNESFKIEKYEMNSKFDFDVKGYMLITIIRGEGKVNNHSLHFGDSFLVPCSINKIRVEGNMEWMVTCG